MRATASLVIATMSLGGCNDDSADLPGSRGFPLVEGSTITDCPEDDRGANAVCVTMPNNDEGRAIIEAYRHALEERGFEFRQLMGSPSVMLFTRADHDTCDAMIFGLPYLPPEQRSNFLLEFQLNQSTVAECEAA